MPINFSDYITIGQVPDGEAVYTSQNAIFCDHNGFLFADSLYYVSSIPGVLGASTAKIVKDSGFVLVFADSLAISCFEVYNPKMKQEYLPAILLIFKRNDE